MNMDSSLLYYLCYDPTLSRESDYTVEPLYCGHQFMGLTTACPDGRPDFGGFWCIFGRRGNAHYEGAFKSSPLLYAWEKG